MVAEEAVVGSAERLDRAVDSVVAVQHDLLSVARRRSIVRAVEVVARRVRRLRRHGPMLAEMLAAEIDQRLSQEIDREPEVELAPVRDRQHCQTIDRVPGKESDRAKELAIDRQALARLAGTRSITIESASRISQHGCRDSEVELLDRGCRIKVPVCKTRWRTVRRRWQIGVPT